MLKRILVICSEFKSAIALLSPRVEKATSYGEITFDTVDKFGGQKLPDTGAMPENLDGFIIGCLVLIIFLFLIKKLKQE